MLRGFIHEYALLIYSACLLAVAMTWPALRYPMHTLPQDLGDPSRQAWQVSWIGHILITDPVRLWQANAYFPATDGLAFGDSLLGYALAGMIGTGPAAAILRYNVLFVLAHALLVIGAYALVRQLGARRTGAAVAAVAFAYAPWRLAQEGHLDIISAGGIPLALAMLARGHGYSLRHGFRPERRSGLWAIGGWIVAIWQLTLGFSLGVPFAYVLALLLITLMIASAFHAVRGFLRYRREKKDRREVAALTAPVPGEKDAAATLTGPPLGAATPAPAPGTAATSAEPGTAAPTGAPGTKGALTTTPPGEQADAAIRAAAPDTGGAALSTKSRPSAPATADGKDSTSGAAPGSASGDKEVGVAPAAATPDKKDETAAFASPPPGRTPDAAAVTTANSGKKDPAATPGAAASGEKDSTATPRAAASGKEDPTATPRAAASGKEDPTATPRAAASGKEDPTATPGPGASGEREKATAPGTTTSDKGASGARDGAVPAGPPTPGEKAGAPASAATDAAKSGDTAVKSGDTAATSGDTAVKEAAGAKAGKTDTAIQPAVESEGAASPPRKQSWLRFFRRPVPVRRKPRWNPLVGVLLTNINIMGATIFAATAILIAVPYIRVDDSGSRLEEIDFFSPPVHSLLIGPAESRIWGAAHETPRSTLGWAAEMSLLPGFVLYALALAGLFLSIWRFRHRLVLLTGLAVAIIFTLGTSFFDGRWTYLPLFGHFPASFDLRIPGRLMLWVTLLLAILAAGAVDDFVRRAEHMAALRIPPWPGPWLRLTTLIPLFLVVLEGWNTTAHPIVPPQPQAMRTVAGPMLVLPTAELTDQTVQLWSTTKFQDMANGGGGFGAQGQSELRAKVAGFPDATSIDYLDSIGVRRVVLLTDHIAGTSWEDAGDLPVDNLDIRREDVPGAVVFYLN